MYDGKKVMALIPARGGSKGVKRKNIKNLNGLPLIVYSIRAGKESKYIDRVFVSTEDKEIAALAKKYGAEVPAMRPRELARDESTTLDVVIHAVQNFVDSNEWDALVLLQPTQPLRTAEDIDDAIRFFYEKGRRGLVSVSKVNDSPLFIRCIRSDGTLTKLVEQSSAVRRQDMPEYYRVNGAIYINAIEDINGKTSFNDNPIGFKMEVSHSVDIDEEKDFVVAEYYANENRDK